MRSGLERDGLAGSRGGLRLAAGPLLTLLFVLACEWAQGTRFEVSSPGVVLSLFVVWSSFVGGRVPGLLSAGLAAAYLAWLNTTGEWPLAWRGNGLNRARTLWVTLPLLAWMTGELRERAVRAAARALAERELREMLERSPVCVLLADAHGRCEYANPGAIELTGYSLVELQAMTLADLAEPVPGGAGPRGAGEVGPDGTVRARRWLRRKDGSRFLADLASRRLADGRRVTDVRDVTAEQEARATLERTLATLNATLESTADGILVIDEKGRFIVHNQRFVTILGLPADLVAAGDPVPIREYLAARCVEPEMFLERVTEILADPQTESFDEVRFRDGRIVERASIPLRVGGVFSGRVWSLRDVTESRRQAEALREGERRLMQSQKLEAIGRLAGGVAHDFNNMLTAILGEAGILLSDLREGSEEHRGADRIRDAAERSARLTRQLLTFSRRRQQPTHDVDLGRLLLELEPIMRRLAKPGHELRVLAPAAGEAPVVRAEAAMLEQAVLNLVINAYDAMPGGGVVTVVLESETMTAEQAARRGAPGAREYACVEVADNGPGIPPEVRPHLFEPFFTTKPPGKGTGLGLASVHGAAQESGGFVEVESEPGRGTTFRLVLPTLASERRSPEPAAGRPAPRHEGALPGGAGLLLLLAEDEDAVRQFAATVLRREGYRVVEAANGAEALAAFAAMEERPALLLTDLRMPGLSGVELARRLRAECPALPIVLMSGWPGEALQELESTHERWPMLAKPFGSADLAAAIREALGGVESAAR